MQHYHIAVLPGDGIGQEVITESVQTLEVLAQLHGGFRLDTHEFDWGSDYYLREGAMMPADGPTILKQSGFDGILLGPVGDPRVPDHITLWGLLLPIRQQFDQYVNLRPIRLLPGVRSPLANKGLADIDMICVRENTEGEYAGVGGRVHQGTNDEVAIQSTVFTRSGTVRIIRYAFQYAREHGRRKVTSATKSNSLQYNMVFWDEVFAQVAADYPEIPHEQQLIDSLAARFVSRPESLDVIVCSNLFGDILSDLGAALAGSMGLAPSANLNPERRYPSLFQAIHGSAPDIAGKGIANPIASIWSAQLMLDFFGEHEAATLLMRAIEDVLTARQALTPDLGGTATTHQLGDGIRTQLRTLAH
ncbi:tartrate dehydrogenase [Ktedonobacter racemifer]|uniref:D-malate dehydrogenase (decarboxylating) n=1 Tax=Ktedonobacter racemifer DSM 44963 TaxID=485913 RepID=D6U5J4_KTERA|nr:tartrate dehydrogenase [Ktedonobacter racemifer]EFH80255.1 tartrate dehydrogenase [Ktedonobacter racemifer DSM 44963]